MIYMGTNLSTILLFSHQINDIGQNRLRIGSKFGLKCHQKKYAGFAVYGVRNVREKSKMVLKFVPM